MALAVGEELLGHRAEGLVARHLAEEVRGHAVPAVVDAAVREAGGDVPDEVRSHRLLGDLGCHSGLVDPADEGEARGIGAGGLLARGDGCEGDIAENRSCDQAARAASPARKTAAWRATRAPRCSAVAMSDVWTASGPASVGLWAPAPRKKPSRLMSSSLPLVESQ